MSHNTFGHLFRFTTWGESHGLALGCVVDGCPPGLSIAEAEIQTYLDKRKPGQSKYTTQRREADQVKVLSGVMPQDDGSWLTTGTPISMLIENTDQRSKDYSDIARRYRPGHADFTYDAKYGIRDYRGGGRSSARETAARVAAGAIARKVIPQVNVRAALVQIGPHKVDRSRWDWNQVDNNPCATRCFHHNDALRVAKVKCVFLFIQRTADPRKIQRNSGWLLNSVSTGCWRPSIKIEPYLNFVPRQGIEIYCCNRSRQRRLSGQQHRQYECR